MNSETPSFPEHILPYIKDIKHSFMAFRNGIVSDTLRKAGLPHSIIFGLQLPQISQIASSLRNKIENGLPDSPDKVTAKLDEIADSLWSDKNVRESRLLACYLFSTNLTDSDRAMKLACGILSKEEADILCFRLLKRLPFADQIKDKLSNIGQSPENALQVYCGVALRRNLEA